jgi:hypothetical protein
MSEESLIAAIEAHAREFFPKATSIVVRCGDAARPKEASRWLLLVEGPELTCTVSAPSLVGLLTKSEKLIEYTAQSGD